MLSRLEGMVEALLTFVSYGQPSNCRWHDDSGERWTVTQAEGGEQGDPLMPLLLSIGIQGALEKVSKSLKAGEHLCAFLDDIYLVCEPDKVRFLYDQLAEAVHKARHAHGTQSASVWRTSQIWGPRCGARMASRFWDTPLGSTKFVSSIVEERVREGTEVVGGHPHLSRIYNVLGDVVAERESTR